MNQTIPEGPDFDPEGCYIGPIEFVRPGDTLTYDRLAEYDAFMKASKGMPSVRHWGFNENWIDSGQRHFQLSGKPEEYTPSPNLDNDEDQLNPFDPEAPRPEPSPPEKTTGQA